MQYLLRKQTALDLEEIDANVCSNKSKNCANLGNPDEGNYSAGDSTELHKNLVC